MFIKEDWTGGIYGTSNLTGSRSGAVIATTWATMMACGTKWYEKEAKRIQNMVSKLKEGVLDLNAEQTNVALAKYERYSFNKVLGTVIAERAVDLFFLGIALVFVLVFQGDEKNTMIFD